MSDKLSRHGNRIAFWCKGCGYAHMIPITGDKAWQWNGNMDKPTIHPSIKVQWTEGENHEKRCCHSFVTDGMIKYLSDCTHDLAGKTVELPDWGSA